MKKESSITFDYQIEKVKKESKVEFPITSHEELVNQAKAETKKEEINKLSEKIFMKYMNLHGQERLTPDICDRIGKSADYYLEVGNAIKNGTLFGGDIDKQLKLLKLLASEEAETTKPEKIIAQLDQIEN
jgi:hypothetical protein